MLPFRKILFPVDYSEPCQTVVPHVSDMVRHFSAELTLVHAYGVGALVYTELAAADPTWPERARKAEEDRLRKFASQVFPGQPVASIVEEGEPGTVIHKFVQHQGADLVMMPTRGRGPLRRLLLGSVTTKVLHDISAAVWTGVGSELAAHPPAIPYQSILCAVDLSDDDEAEAVLKAAAVLAKSYQARLSLVHAVEMPPMGPEVDFTPYRQDFLDAADRTLLRWKEKLGIDAPHTLLDARIADGIRQQAIQEKADLLIVGRGHSQGMLSPIWSRLYPIVRESPCPVLSI
jgi:nucleotide-binding universal stress UspA family protein